MPLHYFSHERVGPPRKFTFSRNFQRVIITYMFPTLHPFLPSPPFQAHVDSSPTPPPVVAPPVASNQPSATPSNATAQGTGQFSTQNVTSQTGGIGSSGVSASTATPANVTHAIGPTGSTSQNYTGSSLASNAAAPPGGGGGAFSSSSPGNP